MRIRRRPQSSLSLQSSDPSTSTAPQTPQNAAARNRESMQGGKEGDAGRRLHRANVDLGKKSGVARRLALQQDNGVDCSNSKRPGAEAEQGAEDTHRSVVNGHRRGWDDVKESVPSTCGGEVSGKSEPAAEVAAGEPSPPVSNGVAVAAVAPAVIVAVKGERSVGNGGGGAKKRRGGPAVLMEGSRCSRVNGRGWRCSQPTLVGYALCEHHLGKGRMRSVTGGAGGGRGGASQLGRTEHRPVTRIPAAAPPKAAADEPGLGRC